MEVEGKIKADTNERGNKCTIKRSVKSKMYSSKRQ